MTGTVRWFVPSRGFGFIHPDDGTADVFVHIGCMAASVETSLPGDYAVVGVLKAGDRVQFDVTEAPYGPQAAQVRPVKA